MLKDSTSSAYLKHTSALGITEDDENLQVSGYDLIRSDHPSNSKRGGIAIYYKNCLPLKLIDVNYLSESIIFQLQMGSKICNFISLCR